MDWERLLSPKRIKNLMTGGGSGDGGDHRTPFEQDYDRAIFSTPIRRLQDKTQVFPLEPNDAVRTRLTHSHEVATVAFGLATAVRPFLHSQGLNINQTEAVRTIARTCGLLHDLGNPPFGHAGEAAISDWFRTRADPASKTTDMEELAKSSFFDDAGVGPEGAGDFLQFEGNAQTLRLVARLQVFAHDYGLNPTCATLSALCKYLRGAHEPAPESVDGIRAPHERKKLGYFQSEKDVVSQLRKEVSTEDGRHPITYLVEAADDIVYSAVDIEDGLRKGLYTWETLCGWLMAEAEKESAEADFQQLLTKDVPEMVGSPERGSAWKDELYAQAFRTQIIKRTVGAASSCFSLRYEEILQRAYHEELTEDPEFGPWVRVCKTVGRKHVYNSSETLRLEVLGRTVIHDLLDLFWEADDEAKPGSYRKKIWELLSPNYRAVYKRSVEQGLPKGYCRLQLLTDYISGMTDSFAIQLHQRLKNGGIR